MYLMLKTDPRRVIDLDAKLAVLLRCAKSGPIGRARSEFQHIDLPAWKREHGRGNVSAVGKEEVIKARIHNENARALISMVAPICTGFLWPELVHREWIPRAAASAYSEEQLSPPATKLGGGNGSRLCAHSLVPLPTSTVHRSIRDKYGFGRGEQFSSCDHGLAGLIAIVTPLLKVRWRRGDRR
jgi:hypothetical protein